MPACLTVPKCIRLKQVKNDISPCNYSLLHLRESKLSSEGNTKIKKASSPLGLFPPSRLSITDNSSVPHFVPTLVQNW